VGEKDGHELFLGPPSRESKGRGEETFLYVKEKLQEKTKFDEGGKEKKVA